MPSLLDRLSASIACRHAQGVYRRFLAAADDAVRVQDRVLAAKIRAHAASDFGRDHRFDTIRDYAGFARRVPLRSYDDLRPYIDRVVAGRHGALLARRSRPLMFALTSGTTAEPKYIPVTPAFLAEYRAGWNAWGLKALLDHPAAILRGILQMSSPMDESCSPGGIPCGAITGLTARTQKRLVRKYYVVPIETAYLADAAARYYSVMRFAACRDVAWLVAANPSTLIRLAETADAHAERLIRDIRDGTLHPPGEAPADRLARLRAYCRPDPDRARALEACAGRAAGRLRPADFWRVEFLACWTGGTMRLYLKDLEPWYGAVPVRDVGLIASEGRMSIPVEDGTPAGILDVTSHFYEFVPADQIDSPNPALLRCHQLDVGAEYFVVLTTSAGLFRYHMMDLVRVSGYRGQAPLVEFLSKGQRICSLAGEKLTENQVVLAGQQVETATGARLGDFALCPYWASPPGYVLYLDEAATGQAVQTVPAVAARGRHPHATARTERFAPSGGDAGSLAAAFDEALCRLNIEYAAKRKSLRLGPLRVRRLRAGFLADIDRRALCQSGGRAEQFKHRFLYTAPSADAGWPVLPDAESAVNMKME